MQVGVSLATTCEIVNIITPKKKPHVEGVVDPLFWDPKDSTSTQSGRHNPQARKSNRESLTSKANPHCASVADDHLPEEEVELLIRLDQFKHACYLLVHTYIDC